ncbi:MAG: VanW family protein, partial [Actinomycetota bacterium]
ETARVEQQARTILSAPVQFSFQERLFSLSPEAVAASLRVRVVDDPESPGKDDSLSLQVDPDALREKVVQAAPFTYAAPRNATFAVVGGEVRLNASSDGSTVDTEPAALQIRNLGQTRTPIPLSAKPLPAEFTTEMARGLGIARKISTFTTFFDSQNAPRVANIDRMAQAIDGKVLRPGDSFSLNSATGPRTPENGYQEAQVIVDGELVPGIGGGVCQVATTLFNSIFNAGLEVLERSNHSLHISKYPIGRDATVSFGQQDLRFRNDTEYGILLKTSVSAKAMTVDVYSSPLGRVVEAVASEPRNPKAPATKFVDDPALPAGQEAVSEEGKPGFDITVTRKVTKDGKVIHSDTFVSKYKAWKKIVRRGTGPPAPPAPAPAVPAPAPPGVTPAPAAPPPGPGG